MKQIVYAIIMLAMAGPVTALDRNFDFQSAGSALPASTVIPAATGTATLQGTNDVLVAGDKVQVTVFGEKDLSGPLTVDGAGNLAVPLLGRVHVGDLTPDAAAEKLRVLYANGYLKQPQVSVVLMDFRPFYILGEVNKPGAYPYANGLTVEQAVALAGGYTTRAATGGAEVRHGESAKEKWRKETAKIAPGDTLRVSERWF